MRWSLLIFFISSLNCAGQAGWSLKIERDGIKVYNRSSGDSKFNEIKVEAEYKCTPQRIVDVVKDVAHHHDWSYATKTAHIVKTISPSEIIFYKEISSPPTVSNRDLVVRLTVAQDAQSNVVTLRVITVQGYVEVNKDLVRVPFSDETWTIVPLPGHRSKVDYYLKVDPGGSLSAFLVNMFATKGPFETFKNLRSRVE